MWVFHRHLPLRRGRSRNGTSVGALLSFNNRWGDLMSSVPARIVLICLFILFAATHFLIPGAPKANPTAFRFQELMVPMRDGARLQTVILRPAKANALWSARQGFHPPRRIL
jgi:predicted acyl esterase